MNRFLLATAILTIWTTSSRSENYPELTDFSRSICNSIPQQVLSRESVQAKVAANASILAKLVTGNPNLHDKTINDLYKEIPFDKLPDKIETSNDCTFQVARILNLLATQSNGNSSGDITEETGKSQPSRDNVARRGVELTPVRRYFNAKDIPPSGVGAYGIVAFSHKATPVSREKLTMVCKSFTAFFPPGETSSVPIDHQMITIWPVDGAALGIAQQDNCDFIVDHYDLVAAELAIRDARRQQAKFDGEGPYLIGWSPSNARGMPDKLVLVVDMSNSNSQSVIDHQFLFWKNKIVEDPLIWRDGFSINGVRTAIRNFADEYGSQLLNSIKLVGGG